MTDTRQNQLVPAELAALRRLSAQVGQDVLLVQGGGGNASLKHEDTLWIKASGTWLADAESEDIFVPVSLEGTRRDIADDEESPGRTHVLSASGLRPSIETSLHALLPQRFVMHLHPVNVIAWSANADGKTQLTSRLAGLNWAWIPYARPGLPLTKATEACLHSTSAPTDILVLANHGLVVAGDDLDRVAYLIDEISRRLDLAPRHAPPVSEAFAATVDRYGSDWQLPSQSVVHALATDPPTLRIAAAGVLYPDHVVFLGSTFPVAPDTAVPSEDGDRDASPYRVLPDQGLIVRSDISKGAEVMLECLAHVALRICDSWNVKYLSAAAVDELVHWEAEAYRRNLPNQSTP